MKKNRLLGILFVVMLVLSLFSIISVMAADPPEITRTITPDVVLPGDEVAVEISFTATEDMGSLVIDDKVPSGWNVPNTSLSSNPSAYAQRFKNETETVGFLWISLIPNGTMVTVSYSLQIPSDAEAGEYTLSGYSIAVKPNDGVLWNVTITGEDTVTVDTGAPFTDGHNPAPDSTGVPIDTNIVVHVKDLDVGVNQTTIAMTVEGVDVTSGLIINGGPNDCTLTYDPPTNFSYEQVVDVTIDASDLLGNAMVTDVYLFTTASSYPRWDINEDGFVDYKDLAMLGAHYGETTSEPYPRWDINEDGFVDYKDLAMLGAHYGEVYT